MFCPNCGTPNEANAEKCVNCSKPLPRLSSTGELIPEENPAAVPGPQPAISPASAPAAPAAKPGTPGSQYSYGFNPVSGPDYGASPGPAFNPAQGYYNQYGYGSPYNQVPYYNYSLPVDRVGVAPAEVGFWPRLGAYLIDNIITSFIFFVLFFVPLAVWLVSFYSRHQDALLKICDNTSIDYDPNRCANTALDTLYYSNEWNTFIWLLVGLTVLNVIVYFLYYVLMTARGATIGKKVFGMKVVQSDGSAPGFGRALLRQTVGYWISGAVFGLGYLWVAFDEHKQGWHDKLAGTYVVRAN
ncbi:MAG TPA: RDD family protein [Chloroflexia bacterium]|nr:RDD family protein [Chloroflexia bacterium]